MGMRPEGTFTMVNYVRCFVSGCRKKYSFTPLYPILTKHGTFTTHGSFDTTFRPDYQDSVPTILDARLRGRSYHTVAFTSKADI